MNPEQLEQRIENKIPKSKKHLKGSPLLGSAIYYTLKEGSNSHSDDELDRRAIEQLEKLHNKYVVTPGLRLTPTDMLLGEALVKTIAPEVKRLRVEGFSHTKPPFATVADAAQWVEQTSAADRDCFRADTPKQAALDEIERLKEEHRLEEVQFDHKRTFLPYQKPGDDHVKYAGTFPGTYLRKLALRTASIARHTGLPQDALVIHLLTGLKPLRSRAQMTTTQHVRTLPSGEQITVNEATVAFRAQDLTHKEIRSVYNSVREHVGGKGTKGLEHKDVEIWKLVQELDGPPQQHGSKGPFWKKVLELWNREHPDEPYTSTNWAKKHYFKAAKRLKPPRGREKG